MLLYPNLSCVSRSGMHVSYNRNLRRGLFDVLWRFTAHVFPGQSEPRLLASVIILTHGALTLAMGIVIMRSYVCR